jgi:hypothetical protein
MLAPALSMSNSPAQIRRSGAVKTTLLALEELGAKIFAVFESFVYQIAASWTVSKLASKVRQRHPPPSFFCSRRYLRNSFHHRKRIHRIEFLLLDDIPIWPHLAGIMVGVASRPTSNRTIRFQTLVLNQLFPPAAGGSDI